MLSELRNKNIKWFTETDISVSQDDELLKLMRQSGCSQVLIGLESPIEDGLNKLELRNNWKMKKFNEYKNAIKNIQSHGITVNGCFVMGLDGHTKEIFDNVFEFVKESELYEVQVTILTPFPSTPLYQRLKKGNRLIEPENWNKCTLFDLNFKPSHMSKEELADGFKELVKKLFDDDFTKWRRNNFKKYIRDFSIKKGD